jgi:hypothetical protein
MSFWSGIASFFSGSGAMKSIENVATEWIETDKEKAEARTVMIKALDPNGAMRRQLSRDVTQLYKIYVVVTLVLITLEFFGIGAVTAPVEGSFSVSSATDKIKELFVPITSLFGVIVTASFGVNYANVRSESKK